MTMDHRVVLFLQSGSSGNGRIYHKKYQVVTPGEIRLNGRKIVAVRVTFVDHDRAIVYCNTTLSVTMSCNISPIPILSCPTRICISAKTSIAWLAFLDLN